MVSVKAKLHLQKKKKIIYQNDKNITKYMHHCGGFADVHRFHDSGRSFR